ncbi:MAG TPA: hypothetical protein VLX61_03660 [Anaerolineales bacterium]|nr:hypothetical protein [Anaerolineales bacterium]
MPLDLTLTSLYRLNGQEQASLPGLMPAMPPRKTARGRDQDRLVVYLLLTGNASYSTGEYVQLASRAALTFYDTSGTLTFALRAAAEAVNQLLLERNMSTSGRGQYAVGLLSLVALRESEATILSSGPMHTFALNADGTRHIFDSLSGNGLGLGASAPHHFSRLTLQPNDRLLLCAKIPFGWESALQDSSPASLEATRRRLMNLTNENVNAVLLQAAQGNGALIVLRSESESNVAQEAAPTSPDAGDKLLPEPPAESTPEAHLVQPSAYAIPPQPKEEGIPAQPAEPDIMASLPRLQPLEPTPTSTEEATTRAEPIKESPPSPSPRTRRAAKTIVSGMRAWRRGNERMGRGLQSFLPRLLPGTEEYSSFTLPSYVMAFIAILVPLVVVTIASVVYFRYGRSVQYEEYLVQARNARAVADGLTDPIAQRDAWQQELSYLNNAESYDQTAETSSMRTEAQSKLDQLLGITRLQMQPVVSGVNAQISRMAANENDLYMLDAVRGQVLHISINASGFQADDSFSCAPGTYGNYTVGPLVDILALPPVNSMNAALMGVDARGNLLYCGPGQVPQAIPLPPPDTNWGRVKAFALDGENLYVIDPPSRAVWVYVGKSDAFVDRPYFFFGDQIPNIENAIDLAANNGELYILHADGHLSTCSYSSIQAVPTRCDDPATLTNPLPAYRDMNLFSQTHFTQMMFAPAPDSALLILDTDSQGIFRFTPLSLELQNQLEPPAGRTNPLPPIPASAMTESPNHILFVALKDEVYFATDSP